MSLTCVFLLIEPKSNLVSIKNEKSFILWLMVFIVTSFCIIFLLLVLILFACCEMLFAPFRGTRLGNQLPLPLCVKYHAFRFDLRSAFSSSKCTCPVGWAIRVIVAIGIPNGNEEVQTCRRVCLLVYLPCNLGEPDVDSSSLNRELVSGEKRIAPFQCNGSELKAVRGGRGIRRLYFSLSLLEISNPDPLI